MTDEDVNTIVARIEAQLARIETLAKRAVGLELTDLRREKAMAFNVEELKTAAQENKDATAAATVLIQNLATQLQQSSGDEAEVTRIANELHAQAQALGRAVTENTPFTPSGQ